MKTKKQFLLRGEIILLIIILSFAFFLRVHSLGNPVFWIDETISANVAQKIISSGVPVLDSGRSYNSAYFMHYTMAVFMKISNTEFFARFPSVIFGLLTIVLAYFIGKEYSKSGGIISALFFSVFYLEVFFSRQARFYQLFQLMFFLSLYLLYKSKDNPKFIYLAVISFFIALDTHLEALVLAPFFIFHILYYNKKQWFLSILFAIPLIKKITPTAKLSTLQQGTTINYAPKYFSYASNIHYLLIFLIPGIIWSFIKNKRLTLMLTLPSAIVLAGVISIQIFALRYIYFIVFPLLLFSSLLISFLFEKYREIIIIAIIALLIIPSNIFFPYNYVNVIKPISKNFEDPSAPYIDYKNIPQEILLELKNKDATLISYFSPGVEWYIRKPDYVLPFTLDGRGQDQISFENPQGKIVDRYSGSLILTNSSLERPYFLTADFFSVSKLKPDQINFLIELTKNCSLYYENYDLKIYNCVE